MLLAHLIRFAMLRLRRSYIALLIGLLLLIAVPLCLIAIIGLVSGQLGPDAEDRTFLNWLSVSFVLSFQLFGGSYTLAYVQDDLFSGRKWRIRSLPLRLDTYVYSLIITTTVYNALHGLVLLLFTDWVFGVKWGSLWWSMLVIVIISLLSQLVCLVLILTVRNYKTAERLSEVYGIGSMIMAGMMFGLPDTPFFRFMSTYGNPVSLGQNAILVRAHEADHTLAYTCIGLLAAASVLLAAISVLLGRKKLL